MSLYTITSGEKYVDIDAFACVFAYRELLLTEGKNVQVVLTGALNHSVTSSLKDLAGNFFVTKPTIPNPKQVVIMDISEPSHLPLFANESTIIEVYDHHFGFESFWKKKIGDRAKIEAVGACTTLIWEECKKRNNGKITRKSATLLALGIISNTLNFRSGITTERDHVAFQELKARGNISDALTEGYFLDQEKTLNSNIPKTLREDTKIQEVQSIGKTFVIGQLELWDSESFIRKNEALIRKTLSEFGNTYWFLNAPSIHTGRTYFVSDNTFIQEHLTQKTGAKFEGAIGVAPRLWLRKEILREFL